MFRRVDSTPEIRLVKADRHHFRFLLVPCDGGRVRRPGSGGCSEREVTVNVSGVSQSVSQSDRGSDAQ